MVVEKEEGMRSEATGFQLVYNIEIKHILYNYVTYVLWRALLFVESIVISLNATPMDHLLCGIVPEISVSGRIGNNGRQAGSRDERRVRDDGIRHLLPQDEPNSGEDRPAAYGFDTRAKPFLKKVYKTIVSTSLLVHISTLCIRSPRV